MTSKAGYWIGGGLLLAAVGGAILWGVLGFAHIVGTIDDFQHVPIPASQNISLEARKYVIYIEGPRADQSVPPVRILVTDERTKQPVPLKDYSGSLTYSFNATGSAQATVTAPRAGIYRVRTGGDVAAGAYRLAIGESVGGRIVSTIVGAFVIGGVLGIAGVALLVTTGVRRSRRRKQPPLSPMGIS